MSRRGTQHLTCHHPKPHTLFRDAVIRCMHCAAHESRRTKLSTCLYAPGFRSGGPGPRQPRPGRHGKEVAYVAGRLTPRYRSAQSSSRPLRFQNSRLPSRAARPFNPPLLPLIYTGDHSSGHIQPYQTSRPKRDTSILVSTFLAESTY